METNKMSGVGSQRPNDEFRTEDDAIRFRRESNYDRDRIKWHTERAQIWKSVAIVIALLFAAKIGADAFRPIPVKEVAFLTRVDSSTGVVDSVTRITDGETTYEEVVNNYFLEQYVQCRETYHRMTYKLDYEKCALFTAEDNQKELLELFDYKKASSYFARYGESGKAEILTTYIKPTSEKGKSEVHFILTETIGETATRSTWVSTIKFTFDRSKFIGAEARKINPLGFQVLGYRRDTEIVKMEVPK